MKKLKRETRLAVVERQDMSDGSRAYNVILYRDAAPLVRLAVAGSYRDVCGLAALINDMVAYVGRAED